MSRIAISTPKSGLPVGFIGMWSGTIATIPAGWALCDGTNGTPDLRDRFIKSVGAAENPGATGGAALHTPAGTIDAHAAAADTTTGGAGTRVTGPASHTFTGTAASYEPAYYKLAFIMKV